MTVSAKAETIKVFTWEGYVTDTDVEAVNQLLKQQGYSDFDIKVIQPFAEGPEQMFKVLRNDSADISFLTLNYIKMQNDKIANLLQPINISSAQLKNYQKLSTRLTQIPIGMKDAKPLYIPWGGGAYGIWANMDKLQNSELPSSVKDLWLPKWKGKLGLSSGQIQPNIAIASLAMGKAPFYLNDLAISRKSLKNEFKSNSALQLKMNSLYQQVGQFWTSGPHFNDPNILLLASYGIAASAANKAGGNWQLVKFDEGSTAWLDTINFHKDMKGRKLEAAEIFADYFIGKTVQNRVVNELGMVAASTLADSNPLIDENPNFFDIKLFWPPYKKSADNVMLKVSDSAMKHAN
jgi:spermidine/putrescine-binding protein